MLQQLHSSRRRYRRGAAVVEFAVCLPVLLLIVFGSIEAASMLFLRQTLVQASYEGAKVAIRTGDSVQAEDAIRAVAKGRRIENVTITTIPANLEDAVPGDLVVITVTAPGNVNSLFPIGPFKDQSVTAQATMVRE